MFMKNLDVILDKAYNRQVISDDEVKFLLGLNDEKDLAALYLTARDLKQRYFSNKLFLYGFVYFSTYCRNDCAFCFYRESNGSSRRYRKTVSEAVGSAYRLADSGVHLIDLTMGEDPFYLQSESGLKKLESLVTQVKSTTKLPVMISPGLLSVEYLSALSKAGADWYACYQETHNRELFSRLRLGQDYDRRFLAKQQARETGLLIEEGILTGVGESRSDIVTSMKVMKETGAQQLRVMSFNPQAGTPMSDHPTPNRFQEFKIIALMRLLFPQKLIPASLDIDGVKNLKYRLDAGANVITSLIPPLSGFSGVSQVELDINEGYRSVDGVKHVIDESELEIAPASEYLRWITDAKKKAIQKSTICEAVI
ncbi:MAG: methylornithine synthase PylB [Spirochaetota bacterium]|nr:MAG: methylornithine synthase PylB [Spirochaetota bacterium]